MFDVNWLGVVLAAAACFVVGGIWYGPIMGKKWMPTLSPAMLNMVQIFL